MSKCIVCDRCVPGTTEICDECLPIIEKENENKDHAEILEGMSNKDLVEYLNGLERQLIDDADQTLVRIFTNEALGCIENKDTEGFNKWIQKVQEIEKIREKEGRPPIEKGEMVRGETTKHG